MSQPSRALYIFLKTANIPFIDHQIALRKGLHINQSNWNELCNLIAFVLSLIGIHLTDEYQNNVNRFQKVPALVDNTFQLSESIAMFRYIAAKEKFDDHWYPKDLQTRGRIDEYLEWWVYRSECQI